MTNQTHSVLDGSTRPADKDATRVGNVDPNEVITITVGLAGPKLPGPDELVGKTMSPAEFAQKYGASQADADKVTRSLEAYGLKVDKVSLATRSMKVTGPIKAVEAAFKPGMAMMRSKQDGEYRGREGGLHIPSELEGIVTGVFGIDQRRMAHRRAVRAAAPAQEALETPLGPADIEARYNFPLGNAAGQNIIIAEFGGGYFVQDVTDYCARFQRPLPNITPVAVDAPALTLDQVLALPPDQQQTALDDSGEVMLDVEIIAGLCAGANISVLFSSFDEGGWIDLLNAAIMAQPVVISCSWGDNEDDTNWSGGAIAAIDERLNAARLLGITICVSSGDDGSGDEENDGRAHVDFPSSSPNTLAVGGTMLTTRAGGAEEVGWREAPGFRRPNLPGGATGGGVSTMFPRPAWQTVKVASLNPGSIDGRVVPDISAIAGAPFYTTIVQGNNDTVGGTSASAPVLASMLARINALLPANKQQRFLTPLLYAVGPNGKTVGETSTRDITVGNNSSYPEPAKGYSAGAGFDAVSGWGVPDGALLLQALTTA